jgi:hypothetical protein
MPQHLKGASVLSQIEKLFKIEIGADFRAIRIFPRRGCQKIFMDFLPYLGLIFCKE